jgi:membrane-bound metal-dependent hydrolase YbcI (DUF457 family)
MPSPLGHALAGVTAGWAIAGPAPTSPGAARRYLWRTAALFATLGMLPDLDLLVDGHHRTLTHGLGSAVVVGVIVAIVARQGRLGLASAAAYASHILLDWLGSDTSPPIGVMALWPFSRDYHQSDLHLFYSVSRRYWMPGFVAHNLRAVAWELAILVPLIAAAWLRQTVGRRPPAGIDLDRGEKGEM